MPRHANRGRPRDLDRPPEEAYDRLKWHEQYICYQYWNYRATRGKEGWNPIEAGSVHHQRSSTYLLSLGSDSWFRHLSRKMVTLAEKFEEERKIPALPYAEKTEANTNTPASKRSKSVELSSAPAPRTPPIMPSFDVQSPPRSAVMMGANAPGIVTRGLTEYPPLSLPMCHGSFSKFNYTVRKKVERVCVRLLTHSAVELRDIEYTWITPNVLKLVIYHPEWFAFAEMMANFIVDEEGQPVYPPDHPLTESFAENNALVSDEHGRISDEGYIVFEKDMREDSFQIERLSIKVESKNLLVRGIQIFAE
jgi:hypothetical protein